MGSSASPTTARSASPVFSCGRPLEPYFGFHLLHHPDQDFDLNAYEPRTVDPDGYDGSSESHGDSEEDDAESIVTSSGADDRLGTSALSKVERAKRTIDPAALIRIQLLDRGYQAHLRVATNAIHTLKRHPERYYNKWIYDNSNGWLLSYIGELEFTLTSWRGDKREHFSGRRCEFAVCIEMQYHLLAWIHFLHRLKFTYMLSYRMVSSMAIRGEHSCVFCSPEPGSEFDGDLKPQDICPACGPPLKYYHLEEVKRLIEALKTGIRLLNEAKSATKLGPQEHEESLKNHAWTCITGHLKLKKLYKWHCSDGEWNFDGYISFNEFWRRKVERLPGRNRL